MTHGEGDESGMIMEIRVREDFFIQAYMHACVLIMGGEGRALYGNGCII